MGVHELWPILEPVKKHVPLQSLSGKTLAVDLSIWVCEAQSVKQMVGVVAKPHLRNLFFRVSSLNLMGVKLVFVTEGEAPKVKADTMNKRNELRYGATKKTAPARPGRSYFKSVLKECLRMLDCLGVPWVQAAGEAEAMCAYLDANGYVDGCITNDGDVFLYGAQTVYRNFTMNVKDPHVDCYEVSNIRDRLGLDRESLVGLAILLGCDYIPKGLPGVGRELAMKFIKSLNGESILQRFYQWRKQFEEDPAMNPKSVKKKVHCTVCSHPGSAKEHERKGCILCGSEKYCEPHDYDYCCPCDWHKAEQEKKNNSLEYTLKMKAKKREGFPYPEVIKEFLRSKDKLVKVIKWMRPRLLCFQNFALEWMEWPKHYSCEKVLGLVTYYDMHERKAGRKHDTQLQAVRIVKTRVRNGIPCFEIEWVKPDGYVFPDDHPPDGPLLSIEDECLFTEAYPEVVQLFRKDKLEAEMLKQKCKKSKPKPKVPTNMDDVALLLSEMSLTPSVETNVSPWIEEEREEPETTTCLEGSDQRIELNGTAGPSPSKVTLSRAGTAGPSHPKVTLSRAGTAGPSHPKVTLSRAGTAGPSPPKVTLLSRAGTAAPSLPKVTLIARDPEISTTPLCIEDDIDKNGEQCSSPAPCKPESSMASPNVSSMIADLQLSSIDWDGTSFSMSPQTDPHASSGQTHGMKAGLKAGEPVKANFNVNHPTQENVDAHKVSNSKPKVLTLPDSPCSTHLQRLPLRERLLLKNASQCASFEPPVNLEKHLPSKPIHQSLNIKDATKSSSNHAVSAKENIQSYKISNPTKELKSEKHINVTKKSNPNCWAPECPTTKSFKFVKKTPLVPVRLVSDGNLSSKTVSESLAKVTQKKSVCHKVVSSSEDEDEQGSGGRPKHVFKKERTRSEMPISKLAPVRPATNKEPEPYSIPSIDNLLDDVFSSPEGKVLPGKSPMELSDDDDDSIISVDSPLPLSERLKLRLLQNC